MMCLPCFLFGHKPRQENAHCRWCDLALGGIALIMDEEELQQQQEDLQGETIILDPDDPIQQAKWAHEQRMKELNPELYPKKDEES